MSGSELPNRPVALVTGANKGIGVAVAQGLGQLGHIVLVGSRDAKRGEAATAGLREQGIDAHSLGLAIDDEESVRRAMAEIDGIYGRLDVLVNNAAVKLEASPSPPSGCSLELVRETFETNVFGTIRMILAALPLLRRSLAPRIVNVSSSMGSLGLATRPGSPHSERPLLSYNVSKAAVNAVTVQFANELRTTAFRVNAADPGYTGTDLTVGLRPTDRLPHDAAAVIVGLATLPADGPTGGFFDERGRLPW